MVLQLAERGAEWEEYRAIVDFVNSGKQVKETPGSHPVRALASLMDEVGIEETPKGPIVVVSGSRVLVPASERRRLVEVLHETHLAEGAMVATARRIWWWPSMANQIRQFYKACEKCKLEAKSKPRQNPVLPDDLTRL